MTQIHWHTAISWSQPAVQGAVFALHLRVELCICGVSLPLEQTLHSGDSSIIVFGNKPPIELTVKQAYHMKPVHICGSEWVQIGYECSQIHKMYVSMLYVCTFEYI